MSRRNVAVFLVLALLVAAGALVARWAAGGADDLEGGAALPGREIFASDDPLERGCAVDRQILRPVWQGHHPDHAEDVIMIPYHPNFSGSFNIPNHSGPWRYLQNVPLVLYGNERIAPSGRVDEPADLTDVYPTAGRLADVELPARSGRVLETALREDVEGRTRLILVVVWDGVGHNVLEQHPDRWPNLARMEEEGTSYLPAVVGSSPSITPATHSSLGTGEFPRVHGVTGIKYRAEDGEVRSAFADRDPRDLKVTTFGDEIDRALGNRPNVGMLAWRNWMQGMLGLGAAEPGVSRHLLGLISHDEHITGHPAFYYTPDYLKPFPGLQERADELDRQDGVADGEWRGRPILERHDNPAWVHYATDALLAILEGESYGQDDEVTDVFLVNYKPTDIVGHHHWMDSEEMGDVLEAQDADLGRVVDYLDENVGDYVVIVTSDHGHTPRPEETGGWPIPGGPLRRAVEAHFAPPEGQSLVIDSSAVGLFLDEDVMEGLGITAEDVARFLNGFTIEQSWEEDELPEMFRDRAEEKIFEAAFTSEQLPEVMECVFGDDNPAERD
jgi:hypothetical protein